MPVKFNLRDGSGGAGGLEIEASKLKEKLDEGQDVFILDVRTPEEYEAWRLSYDRYQKTPLIPVDKLFNSQQSVANQLPKDKEIFTLCAHGNRSMMAAQLLSRMGYKVKSIRGGMSAWNQVYDTVQVSNPPAAGVRVWQLRRVSKGCMTYIIASGSTATVLDCTCDIGHSVLKVARDNALTITNVVDTHMHADHVSGLSRLARETGALAHISAAEGYEPPDDLDIKLNMVGDGYKIDVGNGVFLTAVHAPGHTDGSMSFVLEAASGAGSRAYLFTGDTIFVNGVGRPDLRDKAQDFAEKLYSTYQGKILKYPDDSVILPAHFDTGSITVKHGEPILDTIGSVKKTVKLLSMTKDEFVNFMVSTVPPRPANYRMIININKELIPCDQINMGDLEAGPNACAVRM